MKFKAYTGITWSNLELTGLIEDEDSRVCFEKHRKHLGLHPFHLTNLNAALNEILSSNLNSFDADLKGFLLAYKNPKLLTPLGEIFYDTCFIHVDIEADFYIFRPEVGCTLKGIVNKKGFDHIGVLVHKAFNVSIPKPDNEENWPGDNVEIGQEVKLQITLLDFSSKLPFIRGVLNPDDYLRGCRLSDKSINKKQLRANKNVESTAENSIVKTFENGGKRAKQHTFFASDSENTSDNDAPHIKKENVQRKKSKKKREPEEVFECNEENEKHKIRAKETKEGRRSKRKLLEANSKVDQNANNGNFEESEQEASDSKSRAENKSIVQSFQSSIDTDCSHIKSEKRLSKKASRELSVPRFVDVTKKIKSEYRAENSNAEQSTEEDTMANKIKVKKSSLKRKYIDESETSDATVGNYIKISGSPRNKDSNQVRISPEESEEQLVSIKSEQISGTYESSIHSDPADVPKKKLRKKKHSVKVEPPESEEDGNVDETNIRNGSHKFRKSESDAETKFDLCKVKIKIEENTDS